MPGKNIVICCDGTANEFRARGNTNVVKLFSLLDKSDHERQINYYDPGVGTTSSPAAQVPLIKHLAKVLGLAFGYGLTGNIANAYQYLMNWYVPGDRIFLFGFSRGAYTVRALAGMLHMCGLLEKGSDNLIPYALRVYQEKHVIRPPWARGFLVWLYYLLWVYFRIKNGTQPDWDRARGFKSAFSRECNPHFIGVWDTVKSVGLFRRSVILPYTANHPRLKYGRHAVSIDEKRSKYRTNLWGRQNEGPQADGKDIQQVWFAGVHSDVGGSYEESGLSDFALKWMTDGAVQHGLCVDADTYNQLGPGDPQGVLHNPLLPIWWIMGWRRRDIPPNARVHQSVQQRMQLTASENKPYKPLIPDDAVFVS